MIEPLMLLYIDPGTGSMLFSVIIGMAATLFFLGKAAFIKMKVIFSRGMIKNNNRDMKEGSTEHADYIIYSEGKQYWNVFKPVTDEFEKRCIDITYLTSDKDDPVFSAGYIHVHPEYIGSVQSSFTRLNFLQAKVVLMTTPGLNVYQIKRSRGVKHYAHIVHMTSDATMYRLFGLDYFDSVILTGDYQAADIRQLEKNRGLPEKQLVTVGCTYLDVYRDKLRLEMGMEGSKNTVKILPFTVLVSPSWGSSGLLSRYGKQLLDPLTKSNIHIIIRPHPQSLISEPNIIETLKKDYESYSNVEWDTNRDNIYSLSRADIMISDFSGIIFDYIFLCDKPVMYVKQQFDMRPYDADDLDHTIWQFRTLEKIGIELKPDQFTQIETVLRNAVDSKELNIARQEAKEQAWQHIGESGKRTAEFILSLNTELNQ